MSGENGNSHSIRKAPTSGEVIDRRVLAHRDPNDEGPSPEDIERFSNVTRRCPACNKEVFDDAEICYHCGEAMNAREHDKRADWRAVVVIVLVVLLLAGLVFGVKLW
ncbi:MAG: hypothetical protein ACREJO_02010 [Phycisphaerales bacterium]